MTESRSVMTYRTYLPIACGAAWRAQYKGDKDVTTCFFGDGTTNIGAFHEGLNFAAIWKLPVVFVCENNLYMEYTPIGDVTAVKDPAAGRAGITLGDGLDGDEFVRRHARCFHEAGAPPRPASGERVGEPRSLRVPLTRIAARTDLSPHAGRGEITTMLMQFIIRITPGT